MKRPTPFDKALRALLAYNRKHPDVADAISRAMLENRKPDTERGKK